MWKKTFILTDNNFFGNTFVANDGFGHGYSIVIDNGKGVIPKADTNTYYVLKIPLGVECSWEFIPETERTMPKLIFKQIISEKIISEEIE
jgi:hypothetical protein